MSAEETQKKLTLIRKYPYEIALALLALCVGFLFKLYVSLDTDFRNYIINDSRQLIQAIKDVKEMAGK